MRKGSESSRIEQAEQKKRTWVRPEARQRSKKWKEKDLRLSVKSGRYVKCENGRIREERCHSQRTCNEKQMKKQIHDLSEVQNQ